jgi:hypothetical protein
LYRIRSLDLLEEGFDDLENHIYERLNKLKTLYDTKIHEKNLERLDTEIEKLKNGIDEVFGNESKIVYEKIKKDYIKSQYKLFKDDLSFIDEDVEDENESK